MKQLNEYTVTELKAIAYDLLAQLEQLSANLKVVNEQIAAKAKENGEQADT